MGLCYYCEEQEREGYWKNYCKDCAMLRRMLVLHKPKECVEILKRCLIRNQSQIDHKIKKEIVNVEIKKEVPKVEPKVENKMVLRNKKNLVN